MTELPDGLWVVLRVSDEDLGLSQYEVMELSKGITIEKLLESNYAVEVIPHYFSTQRGAEEEATKLNSVMEVMES